MSRVKAFINIVIYLVFSFAASLVVVGLLNTKYNDMDKVRTIYSELAKKIEFTGIIMIVILLVIILFNYKYIKNKLQYGFEHFKESIMYGVSGYIMVIVGVMVMNVVINALGLNSSNPDNQKAVNDLIGNSSLATTIFLIGIAIPFLEELIFRVSLLGLFTKDQKSKSWLPYLLAAVVFALVHDIGIFTNFGSESIINFISYFIPSIVLCIIYRLSNHNLVAVYIIHVLNNAIPLILIQGGGM